MMGYYTHYTITADDRILNGNSLDSDIINFIKTMARAGTILGVLQGEPYKWYDYLKDMVSISRAFPEVLFLVNGEGEESLDVWRHYFKGGKHHRIEARIAYDRFNYADLKEYDDNE